MYDTEILLQSVHSNIDMARAQVERSQQIVAHSHKLIARVKQALARSRHIQKEMAGPDNNPPLIVTDSHRNRE